MSRTLFALISGCVLLAATAAAQFPTSLTGRVVAAPAGACDPQATHAVDCTDVLLHSTTLDLSSFEGRTVKLSGRLAPRLGCVSIDVDTVADAPYRTSLIALGGTRLGRRVTFTTLTPPGAVIAYMFAAGPGFVPLGGFGSFLLQPQSLVYLGDHVSPIGIDLLSLTIPNDPTLVGVGIHYQFAYGAVLPTIDVGLLNAGCLQIAN